MIDQREKRKAESSSSCRLTSTRHLPVQLSSASGGSASERASAAAARAARSRRRMCNLTLCFCRWPLELPSPPTTSEQTHRARSPAQPNQVYDLHPHLWSARIGSQMSCRCCSSSASPSSAAAADARCDCDCDHHHPSPPLSIWLLAKRPTLARLSVGWRGRRCFVCASSLVLRRRAGVAADAGHTGGALQCSRRRRRDDPIAAE